MIVFLKKKDEKKKKNIASRSFILGSVVDQDDFDPSL
jgi:hypothetical protein